MTPRAITVLASLMIVALVITGVLLSSVAPRPKVEFVRFDNHYTAVCRIVNDSDATFSYLGASRDFPIISVREEMPFGWRPVDQGGCGTMIASATWQTLPPHSSREFPVFAILDDSAARFAVGLFVERGTAASVKNRLSLAGYAAEVLDLVGIPFRPSESEPTWSAPIDNTIRPAYVPATPSAVTSN